MQKRGLSPCLIRCAHMSYGCLRVFNLVNLVQCSVALSNLICELARPV